MPILIATLLALLYKILSRSSAEGKNTSLPTSMPEALPGRLSEVPSALPLGIQHDSPPGAFFTPDEYKSHIELYKFGLEYAFKAVTIFFLLVSGVLTLGIASGEKSKPSDEIVRSALPMKSKPSDEIVKRALLLTSFLVNIAMILGFGVTTYLWSRLSWHVRKKAERRIVYEHSNITWNELVVRLYSPSLTMMLTILTILFIVFSILLGRIMAEYGVLFCDGCSLRRSRLPGIVLAILIASRVVNSFLLLIKSMEQSAGKVTKHRTVDSKESDPVRDKEDVSAPED